MELLEGCFVDGLVEAIHEAYGCRPYFSFRRCAAMADTTRPASRKVPGSGVVVDVEVPRSKVTSSMKFAVLPAAKPIDTDVMSASVEVMATKLPLGTLPTV